MALNSTFSDDAMLQNSTKSCYNHCFTVQELAKRVKPVNRFESRHCSQKNHVTANLSHNFWHKNNRRAGQITGESHADSFLTLIVLCIMNSCIRDKLWITVSGSAELSKRKYYEKSKSDFLIKSNETPNVSKIFRDVKVPH